MISKEELQNARILVVDDQEVNVQLLEYLLVNTGYRNVSNTRDPRTVAPLHAEHRYDLILLDLHMPGMSGFEVMEELKKIEDGYLPVLVVTADPDRKIAALDAGARDFISKPFDPLEVLTRIRNMLEVRLLNGKLVDYSGNLEALVRDRTAQLQRFRSAVDATGDAIFLLDEVSLEVLDANEGACRMLGYTRAGLQAAGAQTIGLAELALARRDTPAAPSEPELVESHLQRADQNTVPVEINWQTVDSDGGRILIAVARDITERVIAAQRLRHLASYDSLTGLPNRTLFFRTLYEAIELARDKEWRIVVLFITLDRFKGVNESLGAARGDELLRQFSGRLMDCVRIRDTVGRLGGDEFALILTMSRNQQDAVQVANAVREQLRAPFDLDGHQVVLTASIGIAMYPDDATDPETLVKFADAAMARAREAGRDGYRFFTAGMNVQVLARLDLEMALRRALDNEEFLLYFQPKVNTRTGRIAGVESLLRWHRPGYGMVFPAEFVPVMEDTGLIVRVGDWIIDAACRQMAQWKANGVGDVRVAVNVSSRQFVEGDLEGVVRAALARHQINPHCLELELTESALMANADRTVAILNNLKELGVIVGIDDFGTGYSSLAYLKRFPVDKLKIDIAFVRDVTVNPDDAAIARAIIGMAHSLHMKVVAEGVETRAQWAYLQRHHCDEIQGFHFSRPLPAQALGELVIQNRGAPLDASLPDASQPTLLIVDDNVNVLASLHRLFRRDNYKVLTAVSPAEGFELLALNPVHVIVCDQRMPLMSGTEFLSKVKEMYPETVRIILSGYTAVDSVLDSINRGSIYRFYTKPWDDDALRENIRQAFQHYWKTSAEKADGVDEVLAG
ncbi:EAL domain-containing protein [Massilia arenosa]|uniref:EAL domain-containing protein n=1 Tax=Zemynaea arenosa TaxID=2561931 RepID=A0A4Y9SFV8_9BURK|nr:EAL domain-containing protein [Massilia arenosa]TFW22056.1 EAL domain-containing protein [Massilia arenosa]